MQLVFLAGLLFCTSALFEDFNLAKQLFSLLAMDNLFLNSFFCLFSAVNVGEVNMKRNYLYYKDNRNK